MRKLLNNPYFSGSLAVAAAVSIAVSYVDFSSAPSNGQPDDFFDEFVDDVDASDQVALGGARFDREILLALADASPKRNIFDRHVGSAPHAETKPEDEMATETVSVKGLWVQGLARYAIIDDVLLQVGQHHRRIRVQRIDPHGVLVATENETRFIRPGESWSYTYLKPTKPAAAN